MLPREANSGRNLVIGVTLKEFATLRGVSLLFLIEKEDPPQPLYLERIPLYRMHVKLTLPPVEARNLISFGRRLKIFVPNGSKYVKQKHDMAIRANSLK